MRRRFVLLFILLLTAGTSWGQEIQTGYPEDVGMSSERLERITSVFQGYVDDGRLPGAVVYILRGEQVVYDRAFGMLDREAAIPMTSEAIFRIASQTKALVSTGVMILQEQGKLLIGDPVSKYLPEFESTTVAVPREGGGYDVVEAERPITIRQLLTHTAGIGYGEGPAADRWKEAGIQGWYFAHLEEPVRETVRRMAALPMDAQPGTRFVYGYNTDILGALIEVVSGKSLDAFLREELFEPLDMRDTYFYLPPSKADRLSVVYSLTPDGLLRAPDASAMNGQGAYVEGPRVSFSGGAGILSTARDYGRFLEMILNGGALFGHGILSPTTVQFMSQNHLDDVPYDTDGAGFGLGFQTLENSGRFARPGSVGSLNWSGAYHSAYWVDPAQDLVVVYFTQVRPATGLDDHAKLRALVYQAIVE